MIRELLPKGKFHVQLPAGEISPSGQLDIASYVATMILPRQTVYGFESAVRDNIINQIDWFWIVKSKLPKRISKHVKEFFGVELTEAEISRIGTLARDYIADNVDYVVEIDNCFNWSAGNFGDDGSCLFEDGGETPGPIMDWMQEMPNFYAFLSYDPECRSRGLGRAFLFEDPNGSLVIFNAYGNLSRGRVANIIQHYLSQRGVDVGWKHVSFYNSATVRNFPYINSKGTIVGYRENIKVERVDIKMSEVPWIVSRFGCAGSGVCMECDEEIASNEIVIINQYTIVCNTCNEELYENRERKLAEAV